VVLLIISIFAFLVVPRLELGGGAELAGAAKRLGGTTKYLFNEAALTGREHRLVYDLSAAATGRPGWRPAANWSRSTGQGS